MPVNISPNNNFMNPVISRTVFNRDTVSFKGEKNAFIKRRTLYTGNERYLFYYIRERVVCGVPAYV